MEKILIVGPASQILGVKIAKELGLNPISTEFKKFPDGENYLRINLDDESLIAGNEVVIIQSTGPSAAADQNARLIELAMIIASVRRMGASKIIVIVPYLAYARQDKVFRPGECRFAKVLLRMINALGIDEFFTVDVHEPSILDELNCKTINISSMKILADYVKSLGVKDIVVVSPDKGAVERSTAFASFFGNDIPIVLFEKQRDVKTGEVVMVGNIPLKHKNVVIADDIISTGGTMANAIKLSKESGANKIYAVATHALMLQNAKYRILTAGADYIIGTDSIDSEVAVVSLAKTIADYLKFD